MSAPARSGTRAFPADEVTAVEIDGESREDLYCESSEALRYSVAFEHPLSYLEIPALACAGAMHRIHAPRASRSTPGGELAWKVFRVCGNHRKQVQSLAGELLGGVPRELTLTRSRASPPSDAPLPLRGSTRGSRPSARVRSLP
jgi:hypothetical protein